jgi:hypothetical protein
VIRVHKADLVAHLRTRRTEAAARECMLAGRPEASPDRPDRGVDSDNPARDGPPPPTVETPPPDRGPGPAVKPATARRVRGPVAAEPHRSTQPELPTPAESLIATCIKHGILITVDEGGLWVGDTVHPPWPSLMVALEAHREAVAELIRAGAMTGPNAPASNPPRRADPAFSTRDRHGNPSGGSGTRPPLRVVAPVRRVGSRWNRP